MLVLFDFQVKGEGTLFTCTLSFISHHQPAYQLLVGVLANGILLYARLTCLLISFEMTQLGLQMYQMHVLFKDSQLQMI